MTANRMWRKRLYELLETGGGGKAGVWVDRILLALIVVNVAAVVAESFAYVESRYGRLLFWLELVSVGVFTVEYVARLLVADLRYPSLGSFRSVLRYLISPMALIDLMAIAPFYLPFLISVDLRFLRMLRLGRLMRILKVNRYTKSLTLIGRVLREKASELVVTVFVTCLLILLAASLMYYVENDAQPDAFPNIVSSIWWAVATLTTVGYGDVYPITGGGRLLAGAIAILGIGLVALPTGIVSAGFLALVEERKSSGRRRVKRRQHSRGNGYLHRKARRRHR